MKTTFTYHGDLSFYLSRNNKTELIGTAHNAGTVDLFKIFAQTLAGYDINSSALPKSINIVYEDSKGSVNCLYENVIVDKLLEFDGVNYATVMSAVIYKSNITELPTSKTCVVQLFSGENNLLATCEIESDVLKRVQVGMQLLLQWKLSVANNAEAEA